MNHETNQKRGCNGSIKGKERGSSGRGSKWGIFGELLLRKVRKRGAESSPVLRGGLKRCWGLGKNSAKPARERASPG